MSKTQAPNATAQGEVLLAKYLTDSIRSIEQAIRKASPPGAPVGNLPRSLSAPRLDFRPDGRRAATEVLLPRKLPVSYAPAAAAAAAQAATQRRDDYAQQLMGAPRGPGGQVTLTQARLLHPAGSPQLQRSHGGAGPPPLPLSKPSGGGAAAAPLPPRPAVVRTAHAIAAALQQQQQQHPQQHPLHSPHALGGQGQAGSPVGRSTSAPRPTRQPHHHHHHHHAGNGHCNGNGNAPQSAYQSTPVVTTLHQRSPQQPLPGHTSSEARIPAVAAAPPLAALLAQAGGGRGGGGMDGRSAASVRRSAPSDAGTHASWWRWRPVTDASYPLTAITDRYAASMSPSEVVKWNDRVARLEAEIHAEKERRLQFEEQLKKLQSATSVAPATGPGAGGKTGVAAAVGGQGAIRAVVPPFR